MLGHPLEDPERGKALVATLMLVLLLNAGMSPVEIYKKLATPVAARRTSEASSVVLTAGVARDQLQEDGGTCGCSEEGKNWPQQL
jgi:hypothetical protein